jgi:hypothetical protein
MLLAVDRARTFAAGAVSRLVGRRGRDRRRLLLADRRDAALRGLSLVGAALVFLLFCAARALIFLLFTHRVRHPAQAPRAHGLLAPHRHGQLRTRGAATVSLRPVDLAGLASARHSNRRTHRPAGRDRLLMLVNGALYDAARWTAAPRAIPPCGGRGALAAALISARCACARSTPRRARAAAESRTGAAEFRLHGRRRVLARRGLRQLTALQFGVPPPATGRARAPGVERGQLSRHAAAGFRCRFPPDSLGMIRRGFNIPVVIGADMYDAAHDDAFNSALLLDADGRANGGPLRQGAAAGLRRIHPGIETFPWLRNFCPRRRAASPRAPDPASCSCKVPAAEAWKLGPVICYEDILAGILRGVGSCIPTCWSI